MKRRAFLMTAAAGVLAPYGARLLAQNASQPIDPASPLGKLLTTYEDTPDVLENAWLFRDLTVKRGVGTGTPSKRKISPVAQEMIERLEIGSPALYEKRYRRPIWPKGQSGVTVGIGYDLRFASKKQIYRDWSSLNQQMLIAMEPALGLGAQQAADILPSIKGVDIPYSTAHQQFISFLFYPTADAEHIFPNSDQLSDDSFGALVSLVYNRGTSIKRNVPSRVEMANIHDMMAAKRFDEIPEQIRKMKRLWTTRDSRGLVLRREIEATLFENGRKA